MEQARRAEGLFAVYRPVSGAGEQWELVKSLQKEREHDHTAQSYENTTIGGINHQVPRLTGGLQVRAG